MRKLKIILLFSFILIILRTVYIVNNHIYKSKYDDSIKYVYGYVMNYKINNNKLMIELKGNKKILCIYYLKENESIKLNIGDYLELDGNIKIPSKNTNFNLFNYNNYLKSKKIYYIFEIKKIKSIKKNKKVIYIFKNKIINRINKINNNYLNIFILGDNSKIESDVIDSYRNNGISHLFAISGMHITLFSSIIFYILNKIIKNKNINNFIIIIFLLFYLFLTNFSPSIIRATSLFILLFFNKIFNLKIKTIYLLILILEILLFYNPYYIYNSGFLLSFTTTGALIILGDILKNYCYLKKVFIISLICFLITIPICINNYYELNLLSPFINIIFVPFISLIIFPLSIIVFFFPFLSSILNYLTNIIENISILINNINFFTLILKKIDLEIIIIYYLVIFYILNKLKNNNFKYILIIIIILFIHNNINYFNKSLIVTILDVSQGDSILIEFPNNKNILVDTGGKQTFNNINYNLSKNIVIPYLKSVGIKKIHYLILSHGDYDHMGEAINLVENFKVEKVIFNCGEFNDLEKELIKVLEKKKIPYYSCVKELNINNNKLYFLNNKDYGNENDNSSVIYTEFNNYKFLFMGDAGVEVEEDLIEKYNLQNIDVLKVGHHGSKTSSSKTFIDDIKPIYSIISVGKNNRYGHPNDSVLNNLEVSKMYRTDQDGSIMFKIKNNKLKIETCPP